MTIIQTLEPTVAAVVVLSTGMGKFRFDVIVWVTTQTYTMDVNDLDSPWMYFRFPQYLSTQRYFPTLTFLDQRIKQTYN